MRNNASCKVASIRTVRIKMFDGVVRTLGDVRHVPDLKRNLIYLSTLYSKGYKYTSEGGLLKVSKGALVMMKGQKKFANLYILYSSTVTTLQLQMMLLSLLLLCQMVMLLDFDICVFGI